MEEGEEEGVDFNDYKQQKIKWRYETHEEVKARYARSHGPDYDPYDCEHFFCPGSCTKFDYREKVPTERKDVNT